MDMSTTIEAKSDQVTADDLMGGPRTILVTRATGNEGNADQPVNIWFEGDNGKPFRPCKSMRRVMVKVWGADAAKYAGRSMTIYRDPKVKWGGMEVGGVRISHMSHMDAAISVALTATRGKKVMAKINPLKVEAKPEPKADAPDKAQQVTDAIIGRIEAGEPIEDIEADEKITAQRKWLAEKRPELCKKIDDAINAQNEGIPE